MTHDAGIIFLGVLNQHLKCLLLATTEENGFVGLGNLGQE